METVINGGHVLFSFSKNWKTELDGFKINRHKEKKKKKTFATCFSYSEQFGVTDLK